MNIKENLLLNLLSKRDIIKFDDFNYSSDKILISLFNSQIKQLPEISQYFKKIIFINNNLENKLAFSSSEFENEKVSFHSDSIFFDMTDSLANIKEELFIKDSDEVVILLDSVLFKFGINERKEIVTNCKKMLKNISSSKENKLLLFEPVKGIGDDNSYSSLGYYSLLKVVNKFFRLPFIKNNNLVEEKLSDDNKTVFNPATITNLLESLDFEIELRDVILKDSKIKEEADKIYNYKYLEQTKRRLLSIVGTDRRASLLYNDKIVDVINNVIDYEKSITHYSWYPFLSIIANVENESVSSEKENISTRYKKNITDSELSESDFIPPREKLLTGDTEQLSIQELVSVIIGMGSKSEDVYTLSNRIIREYGSKALAEERNPKKLQEILSIGEVNACKLVATFELGRRFYSNKILNRKLIRGPEDVFEYAKDMSTLVKENFRGLFLNSKNYIIHDEIVSIGHLTASLVHPREVFRSAFEYSAAGIIVLHNHPSGDPEPSDNDKKITKKLVEAGKILNIPVLDHIIIGDEKYFSFNDNGEL